VTSSFTDPSGVAVWVECENLQEIALTYAKPADKSSVLLFSDGDWLDNLHHFVGNLSSQDRAKTLATPLHHDRSWDPWKAEPVDKILARFRTYWLPDLIGLESLSSALQPIVNLSDQSSFAQEALVRGSVDGHEVSPAALFEAARAHNRVNELDEAAIRSALRTAQVFLPDSESLFLNIIPFAVVADPGRLTRLWTYCEELHFDASRIVFELVESDQLPPMGDMRRLFTDLRSHGSLVALDDVGIGHNSIAHITALRPDFVKVDRNLLPTTDQDPLMPLVNGLVTFAEREGIRMVAEGVETHAQHKAVLEAGFLLGQGWLFGKPISSDIARIYA
jgi:EAL domain-containing protein (putative c-di-GMP-specific phosphodiesterase class I)